MTATEPNTPALSGVGMDRAEVDAFLRERGIGTLSLARRGEAYGIPISFGYADGTLYFFLLRFGDRSRKIDFADMTTRASFTTYEFTDRRHWRSVVAHGPFERVHQAQQKDADAALADNAQFATLLPFGEPMTEWPRYQLRIEEVTGQRGLGDEV